MAVDEHEHSPARMRYTTLRPELQTDSAPMLLFAGCQNSTALNSLHYSIKSRVELNFVDVCGYDTRRAGLPGIAAGSSAGTVFTKTLRFSLCTHTHVLLYSDTVRCPGDNSIKLGRTDASRQNSTTTNARSISYRYTGVMLYQALCGVQRQL